MAEIGMSTEQFKKLKFNLNMMGININYNTQEDNWFVDPSELMATYAAFSGLTKEKAEKALSETFTTLAIKMVGNEIGKAFLDAFGDDSRTDHSI